MSRAWRAAAGCRNERLFSRLCSKMFPARKTQPGNLGVQNPATAKSSDSPGPPEIYGISANPTTQRTVPMILQTPFALSATIALTGVAAGSGFAPPNAPKPQPPSGRRSGHRAQQTDSLAAHPYTGVQLATVHSTLSLAIMHLAICDAVDAIERIGTPYAKDIGTGGRASSSALQQFERLATRFLPRFCPTHQADTGSSAPPTT